VIDLLVEERQAEDDARAGLKIELVATAGGQDAGLQRELGDRQPREADAIRA